MTTEADSERTRIEQLIKAQEDLRGILSDAQIDATIEVLKSKLPKIDTGGGAYVGNDVHTNDFTGRDKNITTNNTYINTGDPSKPDLATLQLAYLNHIFAQCAPVSLAGIDPQAKRDNAQISLAAVYTALTTIASNDLKHGLNKHELEAFETEPRHRSVVSQMNRHRKLVLLGDPGSGKSTFVNFVALCLAGELRGDPQANLAALTAPLPLDDNNSQEQRNKKKTPEQQPWDHKALLPVKVILRDFAARGLPQLGQAANAEDLLKFMEVELVACGLKDYPIRKALLEQPSLLLLDGLDEVPDSVTDQRRSQIKQAIEDFGHIHTKCRLLVTSRTYAYQNQDWRLQDFSELQLAPFGRAQIRLFVEQWYAHIGPLRKMSADDARGRAEVLKQAIFSNERLRTLAERPLLLTLMASLHAWRGGNLPEKREELYADTVDLLLDWWESPKTVFDKDGKPLVLQPSLADFLKVDRAQMRSLLNRVAFEAHAKQPDLKGTADVREGDLVSDLIQLSSKRSDVNPTLLIEYLRERAGLLVPHGERVYTFPHRTLQEYLAACHLTDHGYPDKIAELLRADPNRWREVALLAGAKAARGTASALWTLVEELCQKKPSKKSKLAEQWAAHIAGQAIIETADLKQIAKRDAAKRDRVRDWQLALMTGELPLVERALAGRILAQLGDPRKGVGLLANGLPDIEWVEIPASELIFGDESENNDPAKTHLDAFKMSKYPVTYAQFQAFIEAKDGWHNAAWWEGLSATDKDKAKPGNQAFQFANHPRERVSWYDAMAFCRWLSAKLKLNITLPTEQQWEKAARGVDGRIYPWGNDYVPGYANINETTGQAGSNYIEMTTAVGMYPQGTSPYGLLDVSGNVWEWCLNEYSNPESIQMTGTNERVVRGGSWYDNLDFARCAYRFNWFPDDRFSYIGFRIVCVPAFS